MSSLTLLVFELGISTSARLVLQPFVIEDLFLTFFRILGQTVAKNVVHAYLYNRSSLLENFSKKYGQLENFIAHAAEFFATAADQN